MTQKTIVLIVAGKEMTFVPDADMYGEYIGSSAQGLIADASHNLVMQAVADESKEEVRTLLDSNVGAAIQLAANIVKNYAPKIAITVKK